MSYVVEQKEVNGYTIEIHTDEDPINPRTEWDNAGIMACFHRRYTLGDKQDKHGLRHEDFAGWDEMEAHIFKEKDAAIVLPLYLYDHSGITMRHFPFECRWDSGQVGFIYITKDDVRKNWDVKYVTKKSLAKAKACLIAEVQTYDDYLTGNVFGVVVKDPEGEEIHSCWGYYINHDDPHAERFNFIYDEAQSCIEYDMKEKAEKKVEVPA